MANFQSRHLRQIGTSMIEVLVTIVIVSLGLLGIAALFVNSQKFVDDSHQRHEALAIARQLSERIVANTTDARLGSASKYNYGTDMDEAPGSGAFSTASTTNCASTTCTATQMADFDMRSFDAALRGASKSVGGNNQSSIEAARGCVEFLDDATSTTDTARFRITVVWQGRGEAVAPPSGNDCGKNLYGSDDKLRRLVSLVVVP